MSSKYYDTSAAIQVIGNVLNNPLLLDDTGKYNFRDEDFDNDFHRVIFGAIYNLHFMGAQKINAKTIEDFFKNKEKSLALYKVNNGAQWIHEAYINADIMNFDYYYGKLKKFTLLRTYDNIGMDVSWIFDPDNIIDLDAKQRQAKQLDETSLTELADAIDNRISKVREMVVDNDIDESQLVGEGVRDTIMSLQESPITGNSFWDRHTTAVTMGARMGTLYIRSAGTGVGKSRSAMADACWLTCSEVFNVETQKWESAGLQIPATFISVELDYEELHTMSTAFVSGVNESKIIEGKCDAIEWERVKKAMAILEEAPLVFEFLPNYSLKDVENCIKRNLRVHKAKTVFFDYICSSMSIIEEITRASGGMKIREDQVLYLMASKLKEIASTFNVFIMSATQLNGSSKHEKILDQNVLSGAKSIANRVDVGMIMMDVSPEDRDDLEPLLEKYPGLGYPNIKLSVYKNRRGRYNRLILWMHADKGTCRYKTLFATDYDLNLLDIEID